jgi:OPA family glycerol-3-phosphate transporter-like MFS transporter
MTTRQVTCEETSKKRIPMFKLIQDKDLKTMLVPALCHGMIKDNISLWMTVFFVDQYAIDLNASAAFVLFIPIVGFLGRIAYPMLNKLYKNQEYKLASHAFILCIVASVILLSKAIPPVVAILCLSLIYAAISVVNTVFLSVFPLQYAKNGNQSSVSGIMDFFTYMGAGIGSFCFGYMVSWFGYFAMFLCYALVSVISVVIIEKKVIRK